MLHSFLDVVFMATEDGEEGGGGGGYDPDVSFDPASGLATGVDITWAAGAGHYMTSVIYRRLIGIGEFVYYIDGHTGVTTSPAGLSFAGFAEEYEYQVRVIVDGLGPFISGTYTVV